MVLEQPSRFYLLGGNCGFFYEIMNKEPKQQEKNNAKKMPEVFFARHMYAGLAGYDDETILVDLDAMKAMSGSFVGKPVYVNHQGVDLDTIQEDAAGYITDCFYNDQDGWLWAKFIVVSDEGHDRIADGWSVSNAYVPTEWGSGGTYTNIPYNRAVKNGDFTHLAIVPNPRYESAAIYSVEAYNAYKKELAADQKLKNSKPKRKAMKFFKNEKKEVASLDDLTGVEIEIENGKSVSLEEMINAVKKNQEEEKEKVNMDTKLNVGDEEMTITELVNKYKNMCDEKANESDEDEKENEADKDKDAEKENESDEDEKKNEDEDEDKEKENSKSSHFEELKNAGKGAGAPQKPYLTTDAIAVGKSKY